MERVVGAVLVGATILTGFSILACPCASPLSLSSKTVLWGCSPWTSKTAWTKSSRSSRGSWMCSPRRGKGCEHAPRRGSVSGSLPPKRVVGSEVTAGDSHSHGPDPGWAWPRGERRTLQVGDPSARGAVPAPWGRPEAKPAVSGSPCLHRRCTWGPSSGFGFTWEASFSWAMLGEGAVVPEGVAVVSAASGRSSSYWRAGDGLGKAPIRTSLRRGRDAGDLGGHGCPQVWARTLGVDRSPRF